MPKVQFFESIEEMKASTQLVVLNEQEALDRALDLLDFYATLRHSSGLPSPEYFPNIEWIDLKFKNDTQ